MDRQQLPSFGRLLQPLGSQHSNLANAPRPPSDMDSFGKKGDQQPDRPHASKENSLPVDGGSFGKLGYMKDRQPGRSILRKAEAPGLEALQSKFSSLQGEHFTFTQNPTRRNSLAGRGVAPAPLQTLPQQEVPPVLPSGVSGLGSLEAAEGAWRPLEFGAQPASSQQLSGVTQAQNAGVWADDDMGLGALASKEGLIKMPAGNLANTRAARAALEAFEEPTFKQHCTEGLTKQLQRTKDGATDKSRIQELAELVKQLRKCLKEMGSRATIYIDKCAAFERECTQEVESSRLSSLSTLKQAEAELATMRAKLACAEQDFKNGKAVLGLTLEEQKAEVNRLTRDLERLLEERNRAREEAAKADRDRQELQHELKELKKASSQQQREISVSQNNAVRSLTDDKAMLENKLKSLREEHERLTTRMESVHDTVAALEDENRLLRDSLRDCEGKLASKESLLMLHQDQAAKLKDQLAHERQLLAAAKQNEERLAHELQRSCTERSTLGAFLEEQAVELENQRGRAKLLESTLSQDRITWNEMRLRLEAARSAAAEQASSLAVQITELKAALSTLTAQKEAAENSAAHLAIDKAALMREFTNVKHQLEFTEGRAAQLEQQASAQRGQLETLHGEMEASRELIREKNARLEQLEGEFAALKEALGDSTSAEGESGKEIVTKLLSKIASLQHAAVAAESIRRRLHNELVDIRGNVRVYCRVKPHPTPATRLGTDGASIAVAVEGREHSFSYDRVFGPDSTQEEVFGSVSELVQSALDGYHVCVFSYGQTGAGKTHTMQGGNTATSRGIIPRALEKILSNARKLEEEAEWGYTMHASFIEVYNQTLRDLLAQGATIQDNNAIKHDAHGGHTTVLGAKSVQVTDMQGATDLVRQASEARAVVATAMNSASSRSHCVFMLNITGWHPGTGTRLMGSLCLVDLAGSERLDRSQAEGTAKKEACAINTSLSALGDVFAALSSKSSHVPYRNSKLTYLLQPCLGGNGKTLMFVNINPEPASAGESLCSLRFAAKVNGCETGAKGGAKRNIQTSGGVNGSGETEAPNPTGEARCRGTSIPPPPRASGSSDGAAGRPRPAQAGRPVQTMVRLLSASMATRAHSTLTVTRRKVVPPAPSAGAAFLATAAAVTPALLAIGGKTSGSRFSLGCLPKPPAGMETSSAPASRRTSMVPLRPGTEGGAARAKVGAGRLATGPVGGTSGVKRPGSTILDNASKRSKP